MNIYIDESGDLGWNFASPFRFGGSSRYLTIAALLVPKELKHIPKRKIKKIYRRKKVPPSFEIKGSQLSADDKGFFVAEVINLLKNNPEISISAITVKKENVFEHIRKDSNILYNYMISLCLLDEIKTQATATLVPDPRSIKVKSGNSLLEYLQIKLWFELNSKTILDMQSVSSNKSKNLQFVDMVTHIIWDRFENNQNRYFNELFPFIKHKCLFFHRI